MLGIAGNAMSVPEHHKEIAKHLAATFGTKAQVNVYRDDYGKRPVPIGEFGPVSNRFYSTIGICDRKLKIPTGRFELAAIGIEKWLPNALVTSLYWLEGRVLDEWPMVCEDSVKQNTKCKYRHIAFVPSPYEFAVSEGEPIRWLVSVPLRDSEISSDFDSIWRKVVAVYPQWLTEQCPIGSP